MHGPGDTRQPGLGHLENFFCPPPGVLGDQTRHLLSWGVRGAVLCHTQVFSASQCPCAELAGPGQHRRSTQTVPVPSRPHPETSLEDKTTVWPCPPSSEFEPSSVTSLQEQRQLTQPSEPDFLILREGLAETSFPQVALGSSRSPAGWLRMPPRPSPGTGSSPSVSQNCCQRPCC